MMQLWDCILNSEELRTAELYRKADDGSHFLTSHDQHVEVGIHSEKQIPAHQRLVLPPLNLVRRQGMLGSPCILPFGEGFM